ncbi:putative germin-like protein 2-1 [Tanacetum coccineum]
MVMVYKSMVVQNKLDASNLVLTLKQESMKYMIKNMFDLRWNCKELKEIVKLRLFRVYDQKHVWFEVELQGAQGNREAKVIQSAYGNVAENKEVKKSKKANLWKLLRPWFSSDFCVADNSSKVLVNGFVCKDPKMVKAEDFLFRGLDKMGNTTNAVGSNCLTAEHSVGFVTSNTNNKLFTKRLEKGDVFVFPQGLIHFQQNVGKGYALAIAALSSQNPGVITIADAVFGSNPDISDDIAVQGPCQVYRKK